MFRYIAMAWNRNSESHSASAATIRQRLLCAYPTWRRSLDTCGLLVLCNTDERRPDHGIVRLEEHGVVLGTLFRRHPPSAATRVAELDPGEIREIERTNGRSIVETHWGSYVLIFWDRKTGETHVLRGPLSSLPCYHVLQSDVNVFFSYADDLAALNIVRFSINWPRIRAQVSTPDYLNGETGLNEVRALDAGSCLTVCGPELRSYAYWTPATVRRHDGIDDFDAAAHVLRRVTRACIGSWAGCHGSILTMLSGGLDSSVVLACLARAPTQPHLTCVNFHSPLLGDEREFARSMARRIGVELVEQERNRNLDLRVVLGCNRTVSPVLHYTGFDSEPAVVRLARDLGAVAIYKGELGDNVFGSGIRHEVLVDHIVRHGFRPSLLRVAIDYGLLRRVSVWRALRLAFRYGAPARARARSGKGCTREVPRVASESTLASAAAIEASEAVADRFVHPWSRESGMNVGTRQLVTALQIVTSTSYESPFTSPEDPPIISPLISQPLVELALVIPTHFHIHEGQNRALARAAFSGDLSNAVLHRGSGKGGPELWLRAVVEQNRPFLKELLLDGLLVREGLLDRSKVERILSDRLRKDSPTLADLIAQVYIEAWLRKWCDPGLRAAA